MSKDRQRRPAAKGTAKAISDRTSRSRNPKGTPLKVSDVARDITQAKCAEEALSESRRRLAVILDSIADGFLAFDRQWRITHVNDAALRHYRKTREEMVGHGLFEIFPAARGTVFETEYRRALTSGEPVHFEAPSTVSDKIMEIHAYPGPDNMTVLFRDITEAKRAEEALREAHEQAKWLARFPEENPSPVVRVTAEGSVLYRNPAAAELPGWACEIGQPLPDPLLPLIGQAMTKLREVQQDVELGGRFYSVWVAPFPGERYANVYGRDITERKRAEEALQRLNAELEQRVTEQTSEIRRTYDAVKAERQQLFALLETLPAYVILLTPDYHVPFANRFFRERFGESHGKCCFEYLFGRTESCETCETYTVLRTKAPHRWEWTGPDGRNYDIYDFPFTDTDGSPLIMEMGIDITELKRAEKSLREANEMLERRVAERTAELAASEERLKRAEEIGHLGGWELDLVHNRLAWSDEVYRIFGLQPQEFAATYEAFLEAVHPDDRAAVDAAYSSSLREGRDTYETEHRVVRKPTGEVRIVQERCEHIRDASGRIICSIGMVQDITDRKRAEETLRLRTIELENMTETLDQRVQERTAELAKANEALRHLSSRLLSVQEDERKRIAGDLHDTIGACLTGIKFKVEAALQQIGKPANAAAESLQTIIPVIQEGVEDCRRIQMDLRPSMLDDLGLLPTLTWFCRRFQTIYSGIQVEQEIDIREGDVPHLLKIVAYRVAQEAMNNIAKHSHASLVRLSLGKLGGRMELVLKDNGRGFNLEKVRTQETTMRGLGLLSMRERTELSGGSFAIESAEGKGTIIRASWPLRANG